MFGQTEEEVEQLMEMEPDKTYDTSFSSSRLVHQMAARILTRSVISESTPKDKIENWVQILKGMVEQPTEHDYFKGYTIVEHKDFCPEESVDIFTLPEAKTYEKYQEEFYSALGLF